jgi:hypothetical protein
LIDSAYCHYAQPNMTTIPAPQARPLMT